MRFSRRGFTLLELLIASTMIAILIFGLSQHIRSGVVIWDRTTSTGELFQRQRVALARLRGDLSKAVVFDKRKDQAYGPETGKLTLPVFASDELSFYVNLPQTRQTQAGVYRVRYWCDHNSDSSGWWRELATISQVRNQEPAQTLERLLPSCAEMSVRFAYHPGGGPGELNWRPVWDQEIELMPRLLEITLRWDNEEGKDYLENDARLFAREVMRNPAGVLIPYQP